MSIKVLIAGTGYTELLYILEGSETTDGDTLKVEGFIDDNSKNLERNLCGRTIVGGFADANRFEGYRIINSIARTTDLRKETSMKLKELGWQFTNAIHKTAWVNNTSVGEGSFVGPFCVLEANSKVGNHCCIMAQSVIAHDSRVGDFAFVGHGAKIQGNVLIKEQVFIGANAVVYPDTVVNEKATIGVGANVLLNLAANSTLTAPLSKKIK